MPAGRIKGTRDIQGWRYHGLIRDLAAGAESPENLAEKYGVAVQTVYDFKLRHKPEIAQVLADWSDEFSDLWSVKKHNRIAELQDAYASVMARLNELLEEAERATEGMRTVDPTAAPVLVPGPEWRGYTRERARLLREISEEMGQLPQRVGKVEVVAGNPITAYDTIAMDAEGNLLGVVQQDK